MPAPFDLTVPAAARALSCSPPTVRKMVDDEILHAEATVKGTRTFLRLRSDEVDAYVAEHGPVTGRVRRRDDPAIKQLSAIREDIANLRNDVHQLQEVAAPKSGDAGELVALREAFQLQRAALALLQEADRERSKATALLMDAMRAFEAADGKRREAVVAFDGIVGALTLPRQVSDLGVDTAQPGQDPRPSSSS
jgi:excisionase family DNA binding protein